MYSLELSLLTAHSLELSPYCLQIYIRGNAEDFNRWEAEGAEGWSYADCLPYFQKAQCHELGGDDYRGGDGHLHVSRGLLHHYGNHIYVSYVHNVIADFRVLLTILATEKF